MAGFSSILPQLMNALPQGSIPSTALAAMGGGQMFQQQQMPGNGLQQLSDFGINFDPNNPLAMLSGMFQPQGQPQTQNGAGMGSGGFGPFAQYMPQQYTDYMNSPAYQDLQSAIQGLGQGGSNPSSFLNSDFMRNLLTNPSAYGSR
jgi:hypothetical protein